MAKTVEESIQNGNKQLKLRKKELKLPQRNKVRANSLKDMQNEHQEALKCHAINKITRKKQKLREKTVKRVTKEQNYKKKLK